MTTTLKAIIAATIITLALPQEATAQRKKRSTKGKTYATAPAIGAKRTAKKLVRSVNNSPWKDYYLDTGSQPYENTLQFAEVDPEYATAVIEVTTDPNTQDDVVVIVKVGDYIAANAYIHRYGTHTFYLTSGHYQVFFYQGRDWNPYKKMPKGRMGGFDNDESVTKGVDQQIEYAKLTYVLQKRINGNFKPKQSNKEEAL